MISQQMRVEDVSYVAVEGGGASGLLIHPGVLEALEELKVVRTEQFKPVGVLGWSGSSSGSIISSLASSGYSFKDIAALVSQEAFDMVFRLENIRQGEFATILGNCTWTSGPGIAVNPDTAAIIGTAIRLSDPVGGLLDLAHWSRLGISIAIQKSQAIYNFFETEQLARIKAITLDSTNKGIELFSRLATAANLEYDQRMKPWHSPPEDVFKLLEAEFPHLVPKLLKLISAHAAGKIKGPSIFQIFKEDFGLSSGCVWRDYIDHLIAFARFRVRFGKDLPSLEIPPVEDMPLVYELPDLFHAAIERAFDADYEANESPPKDLEEFIGEYNDNCRHCTFKQHFEEFYDWLGPLTVPPLIISGANITTRESHLFSALATPDFHVADAVRMATSLPPIFKPVVITATDIPREWPVKTDRFGTGNYLEGYWVDGGLYYNAPFEVFNAASSSFPGEQYTMGIGVGIEERVKTDTLTQFMMALISLGYEANVSTTRVDLQHYLNINRFGVGFTNPKLTPSALEYYRLDAYLRTYQFFGKKSRKFLASGLP